MRQFRNQRARKNLVGTIATTDTIAAALNPEGTWNHFEIIARGPVVMHFINGQLTSVLVDDDPASSNNWSGFFGFEIENTTRFEAKNVYVRLLGAVHPQDHEQWTARCRQRVIAGAIPNRP